MAGFSFGGFGAKQSPFEQPRKQPTPEEAKKREAAQKAELARVEGEMNALLQSHEQLFLAFAEDVSLRFVPSNMFAIDLEKGIVHFDLKWFVEQGYSKEQIIWAAFHELSHFRDLAADPERMMANYEYTERKGKKVGVLISARMRELGLTPNPIGAAKMGHKMYHTFYNILDDIYVNNLVSERAPNYEPKKPGGKVVEDLYRTKLFPDTDYTKAPRHLQVMYALLRGEMVPKEKLALTPEIEQLLKDKVITHEKRRYTLMEFVQAYLKPQSNADTRAGERYKLIQKYIEPIFDELLARDIAEWEAPDEKERDAGDGKGGGEGSDNQPFEDEYKKFEERHIDQIDEEEVKKFGKQQVEAAGKKGAGAGSEQQEADRAQAKLDEEWRKDNGITEQQMKRFRDIEREINPHLEELSELWRHIVYGTGEARSRKMQSGFRTGTDIDIGRAVASWPEIQSGHADEARIMRRMGSETREVKKPERIRVRILADNSYSMEGEKIEVQDRAIALLLSSLDEFNTYLNRTRAQTGSNLRVETEVWAFGSSVKQVKQAEVTNERAAMMRTIGKITGSDGGTDDAAALDRIRKSLSPEDRIALESGAMMDIVFVVTDGGSGDAASARKNVDALVTTGAIPRAFQIGDVDEYEKASFREVWNDRRNAPFGVLVGTEIGNLVPAVAAALKEHLADVSL